MGGVEWFALSFFCFAGAQVVQFLASHALCKVSCPFTAQKPFHLLLETRLTRLTDMRLFEC